MNTDETVESARSYLARMANFPGFNASLDHIAALVDVADTLSAEIAALQERLKGIEDRTVAHVRETLWGEPPP